MDQLSACVPTYMLASSLIDRGMNWWQAVLTIFLGNCIVLVPMILNAHAGTRYGIPFPVYCRAAFGMRGANVPALAARARRLRLVRHPDLDRRRGHLHDSCRLVSRLDKTRRLIDGSASPGRKLLCFLAFWVLNVLVVWRGIETIRVLLNIKAPLLIVLGLCSWPGPIVQAGGFGPMLSQPSQFDPGQPKEGKFWAFFFPALTAMVSFWATLSLNIPDFSRYARSQRDQMLGQALGLPPTMALYSFIGVAVTSATVVIYGKADLGPGRSSSREFDNPVVAGDRHAVALPGDAGDQHRRQRRRPGQRFRQSAGRNASPSARRPDHRHHRHPHPALAPAGGRLRLHLHVADRLFALLGPIGGVLIADYFLIRRARLDLAELYRRQGKYWYRGGFNPAALVALVAGIAPCVPGFLTAVKLIPGSWPWTELYNYAWFLGFGVSFLVYTALMLRVCSKRAGVSSCSPLPVLRERGRG